MMEDRDADEAANSHGVSQIANRILDGQTVCQIQGGLTNSWKWKEHWHGI